MALATLSTLKAAIGAGARPNLFRVTSAGGFQATSTSSFSILCKAAALPGSTLGIIEIPVAGGRRFKIAGDRTFAEWTTTVINNGTYSVRRDLENYQKLFSATDYGSVALGNKDASRSTITVEQLATDGASTVKKYELFNCFISDISTIDLSYDSVDAIEEFTVTWVYDFFSTSTGTVTPPGAGADTTTPAAGT